MDFSTASFLDLSDEDFVNSDYYASVKKLFEEDLNLREVEPLSFGSKFMDAWISTSKQGGLFLHIWNVEIRRYQILFCQLPKEIEDFKHLINLAFLGTIKIKK